MSLLSRIKSLCEQKNITMTALERDLDFGKGTIRNWDKSSPSVDKLQKVADYFHVSIDYLSGRKEAQVKEQVIAFQRAADEGMSDDELDDILSYAKFRYPERFK